MREYLLEIAFHPARLPTRVHRVGTALEPGDAGRRRPPAVNSMHTVHTVELDVGPGTVGIGWSWPRLLTVPHTAE
ncbi:MULTISPECIES: hypothetical protein [Actinoalloteichus]|uniref:hypothetical protein n=1 Tax=Actinoalloteichus TaxID=65496 RepID=UPI0009F94608|nr:MULTISPECIES: hypothetical protein [Actinoalloteichus]